MADNKTKAKGSRKVSKASAAATDLADPSASYAEETSIADDARTMNRYFEELNALYHGAARKLGISSNTFAILYSLLESDDVSTEETGTSSNADSSHLDAGLSQKQLSDRSFIPKQTVNYAVKQLKEQGLVREEPISGRESRIFLTDEGRAAVMDYVFPVMDAERKAIGSFDKKRRALARDLFGSYVEALRQKIDEAGLGI